MSSLHSKNVTGGSNGGGGGIKVTYIETQFVTSDAAGFKDLVQRLTGRSAALPPAPHRPRPFRPDGQPRSTTAAGTAGPPQGYYTATAEEVRPAAVTGSSRTPMYLDGMGLHDVIDMGDFSDLFDMGDFSDLLYVGASERSDGCYGGFPY